MNGKMMNGVTMMVMKNKEVYKEVSPKFESFMFDWDYERYLLIGGYGSGKSYHVALKIILELLAKKRKALIVREVFDTIKESCYDLFMEILDDLDLLADMDSPKQMRVGKVIPKKAPLEFVFPNGSRIIFKGMDKTEKVKSINDVSIVWMEEASEIKYAGYKELLGRIRTKDNSMHFILTCNPVDKDNWVYRHFFKRIDSKGKEHVIVDEERFYEKKTIIHKGTYYDHSCAEDNPFLPKSYLRRLDDIKEYDPYLWRVAKLGRFGTSGLRVLPQVMVAKNSKLFRSEIERLGIENQHFGFDFGFEESFNAVISMSVDEKNKILYIWDEIFINKMTDDVFASSDEMQALKERIKSYNDSGYRKQIVADNEDPKAISYYRNNGFHIRACKNKFAGSRLSNTRKIKRFKKIIISPKCENVIRELKDLSYKKDKQGNIIYDQFNIDPHSFSAIWYALDRVTVADPKIRKFNSRRGGVSGKAG